MAEPFNVEEFRQKMRGQAPQAEQPQPAQMQQPVIQNPVPAQPYQPVQAAQMQPQPQQPQQMAQPQQMLQPQMQAQAQPQPHLHQPYPQQHVPQPQGHAQPMQQPHISPQAMAPHVQQMAPQTLMGHMPPPPHFTPPAGALPQQDDVKKKKSIFNFKKSVKAKAPKIEIETSEVSQSLEKPSAKTFLLGLACGILLTFAGNMLVSTLFTGGSAKSYAEVERKPKQVEQQAVVPAESSTPQTVTEATEFTEES